MLQDGYTMSTPEPKKKKAKNAVNSIAANISQESEPSGSRPTGDSNINDEEKPFCPLIAKDSEWVDIIQHRTMSSESYEEAELEDGPGMKPIAIMFPRLLDDPQTLQGMLTKAMSTTEVTKHLVDLKQKANFQYMKKANRLIPPEKEWLGSVTEVATDSTTSFDPGVSGSSNPKNESQEDTKENT